MPTKRTNAAGKKQPADAPRSVYEGLLRLQREAGEERFAEALDAFLGEMEDSAHDTKGDRDGNCRRREIDALLGALKTHSWLTLCGDTGVGKSFVASMVAEKALRQQYDVRTIWCARQGIRSPASLLDALRWSVAGPDNRCHEIRDIMATSSSRRLLLIIDGLDRTFMNGSAKALVLEHVAAIVANLNDTTGQRLLITSRIRTGLPGERSMTLEPLSPAAFRELLIAERQQLFGSLSEHEAPVSFQDEHEEYMPLTAKLLACNGPSFRRDLPAHDWTDGPFSTLPGARSLIIAAYDSLPGEKSRRIFLWLSLFPGGMSDACQAELFDGGGRLPVALLAELERKCLVHIQAEDTAPRVVMEEIVREASESLLQGEERTRAEASVAAYYQSFVQEMTSALCGPKSVAVTRRLLEELANIHAVLDRAEQARDYGLVLSLLRPMKRFYWWVSSDEGAERLKQGERAANALGDRRGVADCLLGRADCIRRRGQLDEALACYHKAETNYIAIGDRIGEAHCMKGKGEVQRRRDNLREALELFKGAEEIYNTLGEKAGLANCLKSMGDTYRRMDNLTKAAALFADAQILYTSRRDMLGIANCIRSEGEIYRTQARYADAMACYGKAANIYRRLGARLGTTHCVRGRGDVYWLRDDYAHARRCYTEAEEHYREIGDAVWIARTLYGWGNLYRRSGQLGLAITKYREAQQAYEALENRLGVARCQRGQGDVALREQDIKAAASHYMRAWRIAYGLEAILLVADCLRGIACVRLLQARSEPANAPRRPVLLRRSLRLFEHAERLYRESGAELGRHHCLRGRAEVHQAMGDDETAIALYKVAVNFYRHVGDRSGLAMVRRAIKHMGSQAHGIFEE